MNPSSGHYTCAASRLCHGWCTDEKLGFLRSAIRGCILHVSNQARESENAQRPPTSIDLEPAVTDACGIRMRVVVVVPSLAIADECDPPEIARVIPRSVVRITPAMSGGVYEPSRVVGQDHAHTDGPEQAR